MSETVFGPDKTCEYCAYSTTDITTKKVYCLNVPGWRIILKGPRPVRPFDTCHKYCLHEKYGGRSR